MSTVSARLAELGIELPIVPAPLAAYVPAVRHGDMVYTSGQLPLVDGALPQTGIVGAGVSAEDATELARICTLNALAAAADVAGGVDKIERIVKVVGFVASAPDFTGQPAVVNGASVLLAEVFGENGQHARAAVGVAALPNGAPVEVTIDVVVRD